MKAFDRFLGSVNFTKASNRKIDLVVLHTTENDTKDGVAAAVANWFNRGEAKVSAHYVVGPDEVIQCVNEGDVAWCSPGSNHNGIQVELVGRAGYEAKDWGKSDQQAMLVRAAWLVADICTRYSIPVVYIGVEGLVRGERGITTHANVSTAFKKSTHWDPGPNFPLENFLSLTKRMCSWNK